jgi:hypothetical protein
MIRALFRGAASERRFGTRWARAQVLGAFSVFSFFDSALDGETPSSPVDRLAAVLCRLWCASLTCPQFPTGPRTWLPVGISNCPPVVVNARPAAVVWAHDCDIGHQLASVGQFLNSAQSLQKDPGFTNILKMTGNVIVRNGMAQTNNLQALLDIANVGITGNANLVTQALNLDVTAVLSRGFSQQIGGTGIAGYMNTALANTQGELVIPATVTGTFQHPVFGPNVQRLP